MSLADYEFRASYNKAEDDIAEDFYLPCMRNSTKYDRISGYFGSTIYIIAWEALKEFIENHGHMRIICSPYIPDPDADAITEGYAARSDAELAEAIVKEVENLFKDERLEAPSRLLAYLVTTEVIDVKIAISYSEDFALERFVHDKTGIFSDNQEHAVGFRGSMNETFQGLSSDGNLESIDVFPNWLDERDKERVEEAQSFFERLWSQSMKQVKVYPFPDAAKKILRQKAAGVKWPELLEEVKASADTATKWKPNRRKDARTPLKHQVDALEAWLQRNRRGILEHATGSGKTFTALCAINDSLNRGEVTVLLVPSCELLRQWYKELHETLSDDLIRVLRCGDGDATWKKRQTLQAWTTPNSKNKKIILATMDTACTDEFMKQLRQGEHLFLVTDEVHQLGSLKRRKFLNVETGPRLGLSATPRRYGDPEGTKMLFNYFGGVIPPPYTLKDAITDGVLTPYFYFPQKVYLDQEEQERWDGLTKKIQRIVAQNKYYEDDEWNIDTDDKMKLLLIERARIVKNAEEKVPTALELLSEKYCAGQKWIVYCDNKKQLETVLSGALEKKLPALEYHSSMAGDRDTTLHYFAVNGGILVSIKCLDEGVDIPAATHALILASSRNPREFIQRRGRILRRAPGKARAYLYDTITIPQVENQTDTRLSIIAGELSRAIQFGEWAENPSCVTDLKNIAIKLGYNLDDAMSYGGGIEDE